jgi:hypothetical protein
VDATIQGAKGLCRGAYDVEAVSRCKMRHVGVVACTIVAVAELQNQVPTADLAHANAGEDLILEAFGLASSR